MRRLVSNAHPEANDDEEHLEEYSIYVVAREDHWHDAQEGGRGPHQDRGTDLAQSLCYPSFFFYTWVLHIHTHVSAAHFVLMVD